MDSQTSGFDYLYFSPFKNIIFYFFLDFRRSAFGCMCVWTLYSQIHAVRRSRGHKTRRLEQHQCLDLFPFIKFRELLFISVRKRIEKINFYRQGTNRLKRTRIAYKTCSEQLFEPLATTGFQNQLLTATKYEYILHSIYYSLKRSLAIDTDIYL